MDQPPILSILSKEITSTNNQQCDKFIRSFSLIGIFGEGGGSYLIEAISNTNMISLGIKEGQRVAIKLCKGDILDIIGCNEYIKEANLLRKVTVLNRQNICYNFPIYYMYGKCCLFYKNGQFDNIDEKLPTTCNLPYDKELYKIYNTKETIVPDVLIHYANNDLPGETINKIKSIYGKECVKDIKELFRLDNFHVLGKKWNLNGDNNKIYDFIVGDSDVNCANYIIMNKINGPSLDQLGSSYIFGSDLVFEMLYSNACLIKNYGFVLSDRHDDNIIIESTDIPRIYKLGHYYIYFNTNHMYYSIDLQATTDKTFSNINDLVSVGHNHFSEEVINMINTLSRNKYTLDDLITIILPKLYQNYIIDITQVKQIINKDNRIRIAEFK